MIDGHDMPPRRERPPVPSKEEIRALTDLQELQRLEEELSLSIARMETDLEFEAGDEEWAARARGALAVHKIARDRIRKRHRDLTLADRPLTKEAAEARAITADAHHRRAMEQQQVARESQMERHRLAVLESLAWSRCFYEVAKNSLPEPVLTQLQAQATERHQAAVQEQVEVRAA